MPLPSVVRRALGRLVLGYQDSDLLKRSLIAYNFSGLPFNALPNPDQALQHFAPLEGIDYYGRVRRQLSFVGGLVKLRVDAELALPHVWMPGDPNDNESVDWAEGIKQCWDDMKDRDQAMRKIMLAVAEGVAVGEYTYGSKDVAITIKPNKDGSNQDQVGLLDRIETWVVPTRISDLPLSRFYFDIDLNLRFRPLARMGLLIGELVDPMRVVVARFGSGQPYGEGEMRDICQDAWKLDWVDRRGLEALEREGFPLAQVTVPELWDEDRIRATLAWAKETYKNFMIVRLGDRFEVTFPSEGVRPTYIGADQVARIKQIQDDISVGYLGVAFSNSERGAKARDQVRNEIRFEKTSCDSAVYDSVANDWEEKVRAINRPSLPEHKRAKMVTDYKPTEDVATKANVYVQAISVGFPASKKQFGEDFGLRPAVNAADLMMRTLPGSSVQGVRGNAMQPNALEAAQQPAGPKPGAQDPGMNRNISSPASNDSGRVTSHMSDRRHRQVQVGMIGGRIMKIWEDELIVTQRGLLYPDELVDGDSISQFSVIQEEN